MFVSTWEDNLPLPLRAKKMQQKKSARGQNLRGCKDPSPPLKPPLAATLCWLESLQQIFFNDGGYCASRLDYLSGHLERYINGWIIKLFNIRAGGLRRPGIWSITPRFEPCVNGTTAVVKKSLPISKRFFHDGCCTDHARFEPWRDASYVPVVFILYIFDGVCQEVIAASSLS